MFFRRKTFSLPNSDATNKPETKSKNLDIFKGLALAVVSGVIYSCSSVIVKSMENIHPGQLTTISFSSTIVFSLPSAVKSQQNVFGPRNMRFLLVLRGIFGGTNIFLNYIAFRYLPLGEAAVIIFSVPVFVTVAARLHLKEPCGLFQSAVVVLTVVGIILATKVPQRLSGKTVPYTKESLYGFGAATASLLFSTCRFIVLRKLKDVHYAVVLFSSNIVSVIEIVILTFVLADFRWVNCGLQRWYTTAFAIFSYASQALITLAVQYECAGPVSTMRAAADIIMAFFWQTFFFKDIPDTLGICGAVIVGVSFVLTGFSKYASSLPEESSFRKRFAWALK